MGGFDEREILVRFSVKPNEKLSNHLEDKKLCQFSKTVEAINRHK
jgi:hypothetical protein